MKTIKKITFAAVISMVSIFSAVAEVGAPLEVTGTTLVSSSEAKALFDEGAAFIDVRTDADFEAGRIPGSIHLDVKTALSEESLLDEVDKDEKIVFYCNGVKCGRSSAACALAVKWGFTDVYYFREGLPGWKASGYSVE